MNVKLITKIIAQKMNRLFMRLFMDINVNIAFSYLAKAFSNKATHISLLSVLDLAPHKTLS